MSSRTPTVRAARWVADRWPETNQGARSSTSYARPARVGPVLIATLIAAYFGDAALRQPGINSLSMSLFILFGSVALYLYGHITTRTARALLLSAPVFGAFLTLRTEPRLIVFDLLAAISLQVGAATVGRKNTLWDLGPRRLLRETGDFARSWWSVVRRPRTGPLVLPVSSRWTARRRGILLALPIVAVLRALLVSADPIFASMVAFDAGLLTPIISHLFVAMLSVTLILGLFDKSRKGPMSPAASGLPFRIGRTESTVVLGSVNALFATFAVSQIYALSGAADRIVREADLTVKDYARQGFFQLLWVAGLTLLLITTIATLQPVPAEEGSPQEGSDQAIDKGSSRIARLSGLSFIFTLGIIAVAITRLLLYIGDTGLTPLRFYSTVFSAWIAVAFIIVLIRISGFHPQSAWLTPALLCSGIVVLFGLNVANPEAIIADHNLERHRSPHEPHSFDHGDILMSDRMSNDGRTVLIWGISDVPERLEQNLRQSLCWNSIPADYTASQDRGWLGYNRSEAAYSEAVRDFCQQ